MTSSKLTEIRVLSFCDNTSSGNISSLLKHIDCVRLEEAGISQAITRPADFLDKTFWSDLSVERYDVVLIPFTSFELDELKCHLNEKTNSHKRYGSLWSWLPAAVVAVLKDDSIHGVVTAAHLDFDGMLARPFHVQHLERMLRGAISRNVQKRHLVKRYKKLQKLFRKVNHSRRHLRDKVDFLCRDLVQSNVDLTSTLSGLRRAYNFQSDLTGEFDMRFMLHKALRQIKNQVSDSNVAVYLRNSGQIDAHIVSCWQDEPSEIEILENQFKETVIPQAVQTGQTVIVADGSQWRDVSPQHRQALSGLSLMAIPVGLDGDLLGVLIVYRHAEDKLSAANLNAISPYIGPFSRAIEALQRLEELMI